MPSRPLAAALVALVLLAGCSSPSSDATPTTTTAERSDYHALVFASETGGYAFDATVTVERDGSEVLSKSIQADDGGTYRNLTRFEEPGSYTVTVNTTIPATGGGQMSDQFTVNGSLGTRTAVVVDFQSIAVATFREPPRNTSQDMRVTGTHVERHVDHLIVHHRGERIVNATYPHSGNKLAELPETGVYRVAVKSKGEWKHDVVAVTTPREYVLVELGFKRDPVITVRSGG